MLTSGTRLGPYEIRSALGAGGMGEVYRARDTRLDREVAIKVLPAEVATDTSLKQRLEREAKAVSKLSHPHICILHDVGHHDGTDYIVMELLQGETLEQRLTKGPLPSKEVLRFATQVADALAKAHKLGITHRDLKPANIMLTKSGAKLMDFELAKQSAQAPLAQALTEMTMEHSKLTGEGTIIGTLHYMAPEQLEGKETDARTDIFALGEVIYEMATGKAAFAGSSKASLIAAILTMDPPPMTQLQPLTPRALERVVKRCLAKDPDDRWQSASDLASELKWIAEGGGHDLARQEKPVGRFTVSRFGWIAGALCLLLALLLGIAWWNGRGHPSRAMYFYAPIPFAANEVALSPDGRVLAMVAYANQLNNYALWTYEIGSRRANLLEGTQGASYPFWSPDSGNIGFFADAKLKRVAASGGQIQVLCDAPAGRGGTWNQDGVILFAPNALSSLYRLDPGHAAPVQITKLDDARLETSHRWPQFLPDGKHFLYLAANFGGRYEYNAIFIAKLDSSEKHMVVPSSANAAYVEPGYLVYMRDRVLVSQKIDPSSYTLSGDPRTLSDQALYFPAVDRVVFSAGKQMLVTQTGKGASESVLAWFDRSGKDLGHVGAPLSYDNVRLSPDGRKIATDQTDPDGRNVDVWVHDPTRHISTRLTFDPALDQTPTWSADGKKIIFVSNRAFSGRAMGFRLFIKNADGSSAEEEVFDPGAGQGNAWDWSRDGRFVLYRKLDELWYFDMNERKGKPLRQSASAYRNAQFSPDGRWVAYSSNESGQTEIYVTPFPSANSKWQVSNSGGEEPRWRADGKELFYIATDGKLMSVPVSAGESFEAGSPVALFQTHRRQPVSAQDMFSYDATADGQRFIIATKPEDLSPAPLSILLNWTSELEK
jgi:eukaryotic-like serine/threonine-protein kinase